MAEKEKKSGKPSAEEIAARKAAKKKAETQVEDAGAEESSTPAPPPRLIAHYKEKVVPALQQKFGYTNLMAVPKLEKIVISMGLGKFATAGGEGKSQFEKAEKELTVIAGQTFTVNIKRRYGPTSFFPGGPESGRLEETYGFDVGL